MDILTWLRNQWDRVGAWVAISIGGLLLLAGWLGASRSVLTTEQIPYVLSGGLGGIFLLGLGAMLWLSADLRDEWRKLDEIARIAREDQDDLIIQADDEVTAVQASPATNGTRRGRLKADQGA